MYFSNRVMSMLGTKLDKTKPSQNKKCQLKSILTSRPKKMVNIFLRLNLSLVTVSNDKFFFFKMTSEFLFQEYI